MSTYFDKETADHQHPRGSLPGAPAWYVIYTRCRHEDKVELRLRQQALEVFLPRSPVPSRRRDRKVFLEAPLFPGYVFIYSDLKPPTYREIIKLFGVVRVLGFNGGFSPVPQETVEAIRVAVASGRPCQPWPFVENGRRVRIIDGPLSGVTGTVVASRRTKRKLVVSVELFRRSVAVELADDALEPLW
jgi:transcription antitermination factor NusG